MTSADLRNTRVVDIVKELADDYPDSTLRDDALYELARTYLHRHTPSSDEDRALACAAIATAALVGVARFSGVAEAAGAHKFLSLIGSTAALPLLAAAIAWPDCKAAKTGRGASLAILVGSALGIAIVAGAGFDLWGQIVPAASALVILGGTIRDHAWRPMAGAILLAATFGVVTAKLNIAGLAPIEILHYGMAAAVLLLCL